MVTLVRLMLEIHFGVVVSKRKGSCRRNLFSPRYTGSVSERTCRLVRVMAGWVGLLQMLVVIEMSVL